MLDLKRLTYLTALYHHRSYTKASEELFVTQPAISLAVKALERQTGIQLLDRQANGVVFTPEGEQYVLHAQHILQECEKTETILQELSTQWQQTLHLGISQVSGGSRTSVGGYGEETRPHDTEQFDVSDTRTLDEVIGWLMDEGHLPSFCTACYRAGRTGDRFMEFCKSGQIQDFCQPNALLTLGEYLCDYASPEVAEKGWKMIDTELARVPDDRRRTLAADYLARVRTGARDFRF